MFQINDDLSIYVTRGDIVAFTVTAKDNGNNYKFQPGDVVRIKVFGKKDAENVVLQKDFPVLTVTEKVEIYLTEDETRIGEVISKPVDYWYEVELNPYDDPQTIIGYDEDGAKVFKLFPEGNSVPIPAPEPRAIAAVDAELDLTSQRPIQNQAVARAMRNLEDAYERTHAAVAGIHITPEMFGAIGDGEADDTAAFVQGATYAREHGTEFWCGEKTYSVNADVDFRYVKNVRIDGKIIGEGVLIFGNSGTSGQQANVYVSHAANVRVVGSKNGFFNFRRIDGTLTLYADGNVAADASIAYNQFMLGTCGNVVIEGVNGGWINENVFFGKRVEHISIGGDGSYYHNNNKFYDVNLEGGTVTIDYGERNYFRARGEGGITYAFNHDSARNVIEQSFYATMVNNPLSLYHDTLDNICAYETSKYYKGFELYTLSKNSIKNAAEVYPVAGGFQFAQWSELFNSGMLEIPDAPLHFYIMSDENSYRPYVTFYDEDGNVITDEAKAKENIVTNSMNNFSSSCAVTQGTNCAESNFVVVKKSAKYFSLSINAGSFTGVAHGLTARYYTTQNACFGMPPRRTLADDTPAAGAWSNGDIVYNSKDSDSVYAWVYQSGAWHELTY